MTRRIWHALAFVLLVAGSAWSQQTLNNVPAILVGYPDTIIHNATIYSMDDAGFNQSYGRTYEAMAIKGDRILFLGTNAQTLALAGPNTKKIDVKGRAVLPGLIDTHNHLHDGAVGRWARNHPEEVERLMKTFSVTGKSYQELTRGVEVTIKENMARPLPGQWAVININEPGSAAGGIAVPYLQQKILKREMLDAWAPQLPVLVNAGPGAWLLNTAAKNDFLRSYEVEPTDENEQKAIALSTVFGRSMVADRYFDDHSEELAEVLRDALEYQVAGGFTTYSSHIVGLAKMPAFRMLDKQGRMPIRLAFSDRYCNQVEPDVVGCFLRKGDYAGMGSNYFWNIGLTLGGIDAGPPTICSTMEAPPEYKSQEYCIIEPENHYGRAVYTALRSRYRYVVNHDYGDKGVDIVMDIMEKVIRENPDITLDFIRSQRISSDHCGFYPRPDQVARMKHLGMIISCNPNFINRSTPWLQVYGDAKANYISPVGNLIRGGVLTTTEYEGLVLGSGEGPTATTFLYKLISRLNDKGVAIAKDQAIDRVSAMKTATIWPAYYVLAEDRIGSLAVGKLADFQVMNKDYFKVPEAEIPTVLPEMVVLGGKTVALRPELAREIGMQPVGKQIKFEFKTNYNLDVTVSPAPGGE
ncbi:MAG TPA: amidohydrolase family protein [Terriglobia bacterium]|nr:amidohydrolase family protein [Terriglobia bacterium]